MRIKLGDKLLINRQTPEGVTMPELFTVIEVKRNSIKLQAENGDIVFVLR